MQNKSKITQRRYFLTNNGSKDFFLVAVRALLLQLCLEPFFFRLNLRLNLCNHFRELFFTFFSCFRVDIVAFPLAIRICRRVPSFIQAVVNHGDTARYKIGCNRFLTDDGFLGLPLSVGDASYGYETKSVFRHHNGIFYSEAGNRPYLLLPVIPGKAASV